VDRIFGGGSRSTSRPLRPKLLYVGHLLSDHRPVPVSDWSMRSSTSLPPVFRILNTYDVWSMSTSIVIGDVGSTLADPEIRVRRTYG